MSSYATLFKATLMNKNINEWMWECVHAMSRNWRKTPKWGVLFACRTNRPMNGQTRPRIDVWGWGSEIKCHLENQSIRSFSFFEFKSAFVDDIDSGRRHRHHASSAQLRMEYIVASHRWVSPFNCIRPVQLIDWRILLQHCIGKDYFVGWPVLTWFP